MPKKRLRGALLVGERKSEPLRLILIFNVELEGHTT